MRLFKRTDLPLPVAPAMRRCGMRARSLTKDAPWMVFPSTSVRRAELPWNSSVSRISRRPIVSRFTFGISMPTVDFPEIRSIRADSALSARHRSSESAVILLYLIPASGLNSNVVTTGPG